MTAKRLLLAILLIVACGIAWVVFQLFGPAPAIRVARDTTYLTTPLAADGLPDYSKWLLDKQRVGVTPENNAAIPFLQAVWPASLNPGQQALVCGEIGMPVPASDGLDDPANDFKGDDSVVRAMTLDVLATHGIVPDVAIESQADFQAWITRIDEEDGLNLSVSNEMNSRPRSLIEACCSAPWTRAAMPGLAAWVDRHVADFDLLYEAAARTHYFCPSPSLLETPQLNFIEMLLPDTQEMYTAVYALAYRGFLRLGENDVAAAWSDCHTMYRLSAHAPDDCMVSQLVLIACYSKAEELARHILASEQLDAAMARSIRDFLASQQPRHEIATALDTFERASIITAMLALSHQRDNPSRIFGDSHDALSVMLNSSLDWNIVLREINGWYDRLAAAGGHEAHADRIAANELIDQDLQALGKNKSSSAIAALFNRNSRSQRVGEIMATLLIPASDAAYQAEDRHNAELQLMQLAAALAVYRTEHDGAYPNKLDELVPDLLPALPTDDYTAVRLVYTKTDTGYLLINCGPNGLDDGGMNERYKFYKGYEVSEDAPAAYIGAICEQLGDAPPEAGDDDSPAAALMGKIPTGSDDHSIRMPPIAVSFE